MTTTTDNQSISIKDYEDALSQLAERRESHLFFNEGNSHALVVFKTIFKNAKKNVYIVAHDLTNQEVCNNPEYIDSLGEFLKRKDARLNIMLTSVERDALLNAPVFRKIFDSEAYKSGNVAIFDLHGKKFKAGEDTVHFCFADGQMYRFETDVEKRKAQGNFNDASVVEDLYTYFQNGKNLNSTTKVELSEIFNN